MWTNIKISDIYLDEDGLTLIGIGEGEKIRINIPLDAAFTVKLSPKHIESLGVLIKEFEQGRKN